MKPCPPRSRVVLVPLVGLALVACGDDGDPQQGSSDDAMSGFTSADDDDGSDTVDPDTTGTTGSESDSDPTGIETLGEGDMRGVLTFTRYLADPVTGTDRTAMAGAWRTAEVGWDGVDDFVAVF